MQHGTHRVTAGALLVTLGIVFGDIGTSPLYVLKAIVGDRLISEELILGGLSCIFLTLTLQTTLKYVVLILRADNNGEGGIFSLYALVRRRTPWLLFPAIIGGSALLADGIITPPISVSSAVEGLLVLNPNIKTVPIVIAILIGIFSVQQFGTKIVGKSFGPVMLLWFGMLAVTGLNEVILNPLVIKALNPYYAYNLLTHYPDGFWLLGAVFLCSTGAEALYSDLGHCGKSNIRISWALVKICLLLNYFGQGAWLLEHTGSPLEGKNPFYSIIPSWFLFPSILVATAAAVIASQALISGSFTLVAEAIRLKLFPKSKVVYPTELKGQIYVPGTNKLLLILCIAVVLFFRESSNMEAAYGLSITVTMLMTTILFSYFLISKRIPSLIITLFFALYAAIEFSFLVANLAKFFHGGWVTLVLGSALFVTMWIWNKGSGIKSRLTDFVNLKSHLPMLTELSTDESVPKFATHLVYMTGAPVPSKIESKVIYSIFRKSPKRADVYWFLHVDVLDEPYTMEYKIETLVPQRVFRIDFRLGFRVEPRVNLFFRKVIEELASNNEVDIISRYKSLRTNEIPGDFRFIVLEKELSYENDLSPYENFIMDGYFLLKHFSLSEEKGFGLDTSSVILEKVPLVIAPPKQFQIRRVMDS